MTVLDFIYAMGGLAAGAGGVKLVQAVIAGLKERKKLQLEERRQEHEIEGDRIERSESVEEAVERLRIGALDANRREMEAKDEELRTIKTEKDAEIAKAKRERDELGSLLFNEKEARRKAVRERNQARDERDDFQKRVEILEAQVNALIARVGILETCRVTCRHTETCPVLTH